MGKYIGSQAPVGLLRKQQLSPNGVLTTFALDYRASNATSLLVVKAGVVQEPGAGKDYTIAGSGTQIVFSVAPAAVSLYILFLGTELTVPSNVGTNFPDQVDIGGLLNLNGPLKITGTNPLISTNTIDGSDNKTLEINSGGGTGVSRGGQIVGWGNEVPSVGGGIYIRGGSSSTGHAYIGISNAAAFIRFRNSSDQDIWSFDNGGNFSQNSTNGGDIVFTKAGGGVIRTDSADGADSKVNYFVGGGGTSTTRGAVVIAGGNENGTYPGHLSLNTGNATSSKWIAKLNGGSSIFEIQDAAAAVKFQQTAVGRIGAGSVSDIGTGSYIQFNTASENLRIKGTNAGQLQLEDGAVADASRPFMNLISNEGALEISSSNRSGSGTTGTSILWSIGGATGHIAQDATSGGDIVFNKNQTKIRAGTSDAADNLTFTFCGGGSDSGTRGGFIVVRGNEVATVGGQVQIIGGNMASGHIDLQSTHASAYTRILNNAGGRTWFFDNSGNINQDGTNGGDIIFGKTNGIIRLDADTGKVLWLTAGTGIAGSNPRFILTGESTGSVSILGGTGTTDLNLRFNGLVYISDRNGNPRWNFNNTAGSLNQDATNGGNIIMSRDNTSILQGISAVPADISSLVSPRLLCFRASAGTSISHMRGSADAFGATFDFFKSRATNGSADTISVNGDALGYLNFYGSDGATFIQSASVMARIDGVPALNDMPGRLEFHTTSSGFSSPSRRWYIDNAGNLLQDISYGGYIGFQSTNGSIRQTTVDGSDNRRLYLSGSGDLGSQSRGAFISLSGNEASSTGGSVRIEAGNAAGAEIRFSIAGNQKFTITDAGHLQVNTGSDISFNSSSGGIIRSDTTDGADNKRVYLCGGGGVGTTRGGEISVDGNEAFYAGSVRIFGGAVTGGHVDITTTAINNAIRFYTNNSLRWYVDTNGVMQQDATNGSFVRLDKASTNILLPTATSITAAGTTVTDATQLTAVFNNVTTVAASTGVKVWDHGNGMLWVRNSGANALNVFGPDSSATINGGSAGAAVSVAVGAMLGIVRVAANTWVAFEAPAA